MPFQPPLEAAAGPWADHALTLPPPDQPVPEAFAFSAPSFAQTALETRRKPSLTRTGKKARKGKSV
eukprot:1152939-Rhodomonas_salina.1